MDDYEDWPGTWWEENHMFVMYLKYRMGYVIIPKPNCSSREGINSRCRHFDLLLFCRFDSVCHRYNRSFCARFGRFSPIKTLLGWTVIQTHERKEWHSIRTVWDISRDDRARTTTCSLRTETDLGRIIIIDYEELVCHDVIFLCFPFRVLSSCNTNNLCCTGKFNTSSSSFIHSSFIHRFCLWYHRAMWAMR